MIDINKHKYFLVQILKDIYSDIELANYLGFKGGTALMFFYDLPRFSVDLDFNLINEGKEKLELSERQQIRLLEHVLTLMAFQMMLLLETNGDINAARYEWFERLCRKRFFRIINSQIAAEQVSADDRAVGLPGHHVCRRQEELHAPTVLDGGVVGDRDPRVRIVLQRVKGEAEALPFRAQGHR